MANMMSNKSELKSHEPDAQKRKKEACAKKRQQNSADGSYSGGDC
jgi:hypothetical protein